MLLLILAAAVQGDEGSRLARHFETRCQSLWRNTTQEHVGLAWHKGFAFVNNVKAASQDLSKRLGTLKYHGHVATCPCEGDACRNLACVTRADVERLFVFAVVRDPIRKFESGVRQTWLSRLHSRKHTADEMLAQQIGRPFVEDYRWVNEHLQPSSYRLTNRMGDGQLLRVDYIIKLEKIDDMWPPAARRILEPLGEDGNLDENLAFVKEPIARATHLQLQRRRRPPSLLAQSAVGRRDPTLLRLENIWPRVRLLRLSASPGLSSC